MDSSVRRDNGRRQSKWVARRCDKGRRVSVAVLALIALALVPASAASIDGPSPPLLDDFNRPDENPLSQGGNWQNLGGGPGLAVSGQMVWSYPFTKRSYRIEHYPGDVEVTVKTAIVSPGNNDRMEVLCCLKDETGGAWDGYIVRFLTAQAPFPDTWQIVKVVNGAQTVLSSISPVVQVGGGDRIGLRRVGSLIEGWHFTGGAWVKVLEAVDGEYTSGKIGIGITSNNFADGHLDDFGGGGAEPPSSGEPPPEQSNGICTGSGVHAHSTSRCLSDPVNTLTGAFIAQTEDISTPGTGVSFAWSRNYTSSDPTVGRLGPGWIDNYSTSLSIGPNGDVVLRGDDGQVVDYVKQADGSFAGAPGSLSTLSAVAGGYELVRTDQVLYGFDAVGRLTSMKDRNGQGLEFVYDGQGQLTKITDAANRETTVTYNASGLVSQVETPDGRRVAYGYASGRLTSVTDVRGKPWTYSYDPGGRLAAIVDPLQHTQVANVYDANGRVQSQTDALGKTTSFAWDADAEIASVTDANGNVWKHDYDDAVLSTQIDPLNRVTAFAHDSDLNMSGVTSPTDEQTTMAYDAKGNMLSATAPASLGNAQKTFVYSPRNDPVRITDGKGTVSAYAYDASGNTISVSQDGTQVASYTYDVSGRVLTSIDGNGKTTTHVYDADGNLASVTDPVGNETSYTYDPAGRVLSRVDPKGNLSGASSADFSWAWTYNAAGQVLSERDPLGNVTTHIYDDAGNELTVTDAKGRTTTYAYDDANRALSETRPDPDGGGPLQAPVTIYTYDDVGNRLSATDPLGRTTTFAYDAANRLASTTGADPDGAASLVAPTTTHAYDANGNLASVVEPRGNVQGGSPDDYRTRYSYDAAGRLLMTTDPLGHVTANAYDLVGNIVSIRDANSHTTAYAYDAAGRTVTVTAPDGGSTTYTYDDAGNRLTRRDDSTHVTSYAYDDAGHLVSETGPDPDGVGPRSPAVTSHSYDANGNRLTTVNPNGNATSVEGDGKTTFGYDRANRLTSIDYSDSTPDVAFTYDPVGNRLQMADGSGTETRTYDGLDRLLSVTRGSTAFSYAYDAVGNVTRRTYPGGTVTDYDYDGLDRLSIARSNGQTTGYGYDVSSNLVQTTLPAGNGHVDVRQYDRAGRLTEVTSRKGATTLASFVATHDPVGNPTQVVRTGAFAQTQMYAYDASDRIVSVCFQATMCSGAFDPFIRWTYDKVGNRLTEQRSSGTTSYSYDAADQLLTAGPTSYTYDQNGNEVSAGSRTFTYDLANRMKTTKLGSTTTTYSYDGDDVRLQASTGVKASQKTNFLWDVTHALPQIAIEQSGSGSVVREYTYGARRISMTSGSATSYYHYDALGSVASVTSSTGVKRWTLAYQPFGTITTEQKSGNAPTNLMKFTGEYLDPTGLYHLRARQYDPATGRFLRGDPAAQAPGNRAISAYAYAESRPTVMVDSSGETFQPVDDGLVTPAFAGSLVNWQSPELRCLSFLCGPRSSPSPKPALVHPIPAGYSATHGAKHKTDGLEPRPYWAFDFFPGARTPVLAVQSGRIRKTSGNSPTLGEVKFGIFGWSLYLQADSGSDFFYTHLGKRTVALGDRVRAGQVVGTVGSWIRSNGSSNSHLHLGVDGGSVTIEMVARAPRVRL